METSDQRGEKEGGEGENCKKISKEGRTEMRVWRVSENDRIAVSVIEKKLSSLKGKKLILSVVDEDSGTTHYGIGRMTFPPLRKELPEASKLKKNLESMLKYKIYENLSALGYVVKTGFKFGSHFRVYSGKQKHSQFLVHAIPKDHIFSLHELSRSVRLASSVKKRMVFGYPSGKGVRYIEVSRVKL
jgi:tRNA splicing endonuclease